MRRPDLLSDTKFPISGIQAFSVCFYEYLVLTVYDVVMSHLSGGLFFENTNSMVKGLWLAVCLPWQRRDRGRPDVVIVIGTGRKVRTFRLQITGFWISCRPSCRPNGQDDGRHDGRHESPEKAYKS